MRTMQGPSAHLSWQELACHDEAHTPYPVEWRDTRAVPLALEFEALRVLCGHRPLLITSAYRTPAWNRAIGGAPKSQHVEGYALDLVPTKPTSVEELGRLAIMRAKTPGSRIRYIKIYPGWVHIDIRPTARLTVQRA